MSATQTYAGAPQSVSTATWPVKQPQMVRKSTARARWYARIVAHGTTWKKTEPAGRGAGVGQLRWVTPKVWCATIAASARGSAAADVRARAHAP